MTNETLHQEETIEEMVSKLHAERKKEGGGDIYPIARRVQVLSSKGYEYYLTREEEERLYSSFMRCRQGGKILPDFIEHGYELARMFMLVRFFFPTLNPTPSKEEMEEFSETAKLLVEKKEFSQLSSFLETCASFMSKE